MKRYFSVELKDKAVDILYFSSRRKNPMKINTKTNNDLSLRSMDPVSKAW